MVRTVLLTGVAVLTLASCTGWGSGEEEEEEEEEEATTEPPATTVSAGREKPVSENAWLGSYALWVAELRVALARVGTLAGDKRGRAALSGDQEFQAALAALRECGTSLSERLGEPPSSLRRPARILARACGSFERGVELEEKALAANNERLLRKAMLAWLGASRLVAKANAKLPTPQARQRLPLPATAGQVRQSRVEPFFGRVADALAAPEIEVRCWAPREWRKLLREEFGKQRSLAGFATPAYQRVNLAPDVCKALATLAYTKERPEGHERLPVSFAVGVLMHEAGHLNESGDFYGAGQNEKLAECWAMQHIRKAARALGAERSYANQLAADYWEVIYPTSERRYRSPKCRNGGKYDLDKGSDVWP